MIGPMPPFRGGIAQHTMMLALALAPKSELLVVSYVRQYPHWLYPGAGDIDPDASRMDVSWCRYVIDSLNPWTWRRATEQVLAHSPDVVVLPWWSVYWAPCTAFMSRRFANRGVNVLFVCHNVVDHEASTWKRQLARIALARGNRFIVQSDAQRQQLHELTGSTSITVHPHPIYVQFPDPARALPRRAALELLFFGFVRPYKGLDVLLSALASSGKQDVKLTVAGEFWQGADTAKKLINDLGIADRVELIDRYVADAEAAALFDRADAIVLPYRHATGSGVLGLAYRYRKPVIASRISGLAELVLEGETGLLVEPGSETALAGALNAMTAARATAMVPAIKRQADGLTWDSLAATVMAPAPAPVQSADRRCA